MAERLQNRRGTWIAASLLGVALGVGAILGVNLPGPSVAQARVSDQEPPDTLILTDGRILRGWLMEEGDLEVKFLVEVSGIKASRTFKRDTILEIRRGEHNESAAEEPEQDLDDELVATRSIAAPSAPRRPESSSGDGPTRFYVVELKERWGFDVSETPLRRLFKNVDDTFGDLVPGYGVEDGRMVVDPLLREKHIVVLKMDLMAPGGFNAIFRAEELAPILMDEIVHKGRRVVFWVEMAAGGAAFLPWVSSEIFFTEDGVLGGMADLDEFSTGDAMVDEKLIGAFLGAAEGFAIKGGYADHLDVMRAMLRTQNWLYVWFEGGRPVYSTTRPEVPGWMLLSDDGEGDNKDESAFDPDGNDLLTLHAALAEQLGISDGTASTVDDIAFYLGVGRHYEIIEDHKGQKIMDRWTEDLERAMRMAYPEQTAFFPRGTLWDEYEDIQVNGDFPERRRARGRQIRLLSDIVRLLHRYEEVLDPNGTIQEGVQFRIDNHKLEMEIDAREQRRSGGDGR